jgi:DNA topoisomerase-1
MNRELTGQYLINQFGAGTKKWTTLEHNGVLFPPSYIPHKIPLIYNGNKMELDADTEEMATLYAKFVETEYIKESVFRRNFWNDWKKLLGKGSPIESLDNCDFTLIYEHLLKLKETKKLEKKDDSNKEDVERYKTAMVDGKIQPVGNFRMEPPGIFLGRGCNPKLGKIKNRIYPEDITINIGKGSPVPEIPDFLQGHKWGEIIHNNYVEWLASWKDNITGKTKYVWLGAHSDLKAKSDMEKFDLARKLKKKIKIIREKNEIELKGNDKKMKQVATALYFIDKYALRVGNEKGDDDTDTVGITSLRVEHVQLLDDNKIKLDFLGKDSVRYNRLIHVDEIIYTNIKLFMEGKELDDQLFDLVSSGDINEYLKSCMKNLTAKVFRTYNASNLFQKELTKITAKYQNYGESDKINLLLDEFNKANGKVALLCNHQKNINKSSVKQIDTININIKKVKTRLRKEKKGKKDPAKIEELKNKLKKLKAKKDMKIELKNISLGTSKVNYIDPRITVAFLKKHDMPIDKIFPKTLQEKFKWAFDADESFRF